MPAKFAVPAARSTSVCGPGGEPMRKGKSPFQTSQEGKIIEGGFEARKRPVPSPVPGEPDRITVAVGSYTGTVELGFRSIGARSYVISISETDPSVAEPKWTVAGTTTQRKFTVEGLVSGKAYWFKISALGIAGEGPACEPLMARAA